MLNAMTAK